MGHTNCGAIKGACSHVKLGKLTSLLSEISPAVEQVKKQTGNKFSCKNAEDIDSIAKQNVLNQMQLILKNSSTIRNLIDEKKIMLVGAMHNISTGKVDFFSLNGKQIS